MIDQILGHKASLGTFKKAEIISSISHNHNSMRPEVNYKEKKQNTHIQRLLNNMLLNNQWITEVKTNQKVSRDECK